VLDVEWRSLTHDIRDELPFSSVGNAGLLT
jgi:hypothetical protein